MHCNTLSILLVIASLKVKQSNIQPHPSPPRKGGSSSGGLFSPSKRTKGLAMKEILYNFLLGFLSPFQESVNNRYDVHIEQRRCKQST